MNSPRISILFWSIYEFAIGAALFLVPTQITGLFGIDEPVEVWIRVLGAVAIGLGIFYLMSTFSDSRWFYRASVLVRSVIAVLFAFLAVTDGPWQLWIFAVWTALATMWTYVALRNTGDGRSTADAPQLRDEGEAASA
jgi:hypothetical protein